MSDRQKLLMSGSVYGYLRWSSEDQGEGTSEERQREDISAFTDKLGVEITEWIIDDGVSARDGYNLDHGNIAKLRHKIISGKVSADALVLVADASRLSRAESADFDDFISPLLKRGTRIGIAKNKLVLDRRDPQSLINKFLFSIDQQGAHKTNEDRVNYIRSEKAIRRSKVRTVPGTVFTAMVPEWIVCPLSTGRGNAPRIMHLHPVRGAVLFEIFTMAVTWGSTVIAKKLNDLAKTDPKYAAWSKNGQWRPERIDKLLSDRKVLGEFQMHVTEAKPEKNRPKRIPDGPLMLNYYPEAIKSDLWRKVVAARALRARVKSGRPSRTGVNLFAGLCRCGTCGETLTVIPATPLHPYDRLYCVKRKRGLCTNGTSHNLLRFERAFLADALGFLTRDSDFSEATEDIDRAASIVDFCSGNLREAEEGLASVLATARLARSESARARLIAQVEDENEQVRAARSALEAAEKQLDVARGTDFKGSALRAELLVADARSGDDRLSLGCQTARAQLRQLIQTIVARIDFGNTCAVISPARPAVQAWHDAPSDYVQVERPARKIAVEFLPIRVGAGHKTPVKAEIVRWAEDADLVTSETWKRTIPARVRKPARAEFGVWLEHDGRRMCASAWSREIGVSPSAIAWRLARGWSVERTLTTPRGRVGPKGTTYAKL